MEAGGATFSESRDFQSYRHTNVGIQHGTPVIATKGRGKGGVVITNGWVEGEASDNLKVSIVRRIIFLAINKGKKKL